MALRLFNTLTRKKETFTPIQKDVVRMYTCGPTVYDYAHIGNFRTYVFEDILRRTLEFNGFKVKQVMNLTDVDDKTIKRSREQHVPLQLYTEKYKKAFFEDIKTLNIEPAESYPAATDHVQEMIALIEALLDQGVAYMGEDKCVYFSIKKFKQYGKLAHIKTKDLKAGARVKQDEYEKDAASDFALWKAWDEEDGDVSWESPFGRGRPGWHIECSAMSMKHLSDAFARGHFDPAGFETIDLHTGGVDNKFPHHEDEIAQSEAATGKQFVKTWLHAEHLLVDNKKMSKSLGNFYTLRDLITKGYSPQAIRYTLLASQYRQQLNFTFPVLEASAQALGRMQEFIWKVMDANGKYADGKKSNITKAIAGAEKGFTDSVNDDLNMPQALAAVFTFIKDANILLDQGKVSKQDAQAIIAFIRKADRILGVLSFERGSIDDEIEQLIQEREQARKKKDFARADAIRKQLEGQGILLDDTPQGVRWKRK
jgi:cysteinyl-tRNA synthetase